jgi:hypothetical protein
MIRSFTAQTGVGACDDDSLAGEGVGGNGKVHEELAVEQGEACAGTHNSCHSNRQESDERKRQTGCLRVGSQGKSDSGAHKVRKMKDDTNPSQH